MCVCVLVPCVCGGHAHAAGTIAQDIRHCFSAVLNGPTDRAALVHQCTHVGCCATRADAESKVVKAVLGVLMRLVPTVPVMSDWTKVGPAVDWFLSADFAGHLDPISERCEIRGSNSQVGGSRGPR